MKRAYDAVIIGSGFGGSINALRLAQAGTSVLVLERGRRYRTGEFPRDVTDVNKVFWRYPEKGELRGLYDVRFLSGIATVVASGVGGGSLVYANVHIRPEASVFDQPRWPRSINRARLEPYYDRVAKVFRVSPVPQKLGLPKRDAFYEASRKMHREVFDPDEAVDWGKCPGVSECEFGCQKGAKNTVDLTYLAEAERLGAIVRTDANATHIDQVDGGYRVHVNHLNDGSSAIIFARRVVVSAGTLGTNEILLRSREVTRTLPKLSDRLGHGYSGNGDFLGTIQNSSREVMAWEGPDVTSVMRFDGRTDLRWPHQVLVIQRWRCSHRSGNSTDAGCAGSGRSCGRSWEEFCVVCVKFSKRRSGKSWKKGQAYSQTLRQGEVAAAGAPQGQSSGAGAQPEQPVCE